MRLPALFACALALVSTAPAGAATLPAETGQALQRMESLFSTRYPLPDVAKAYVRMLEQNRAGGRYDGLDTCAFAAKVQSDLMAVHKDRHIFVACGHAQGHGTDLVTSFDGGFGGVELYPDIPAGSLKSEGPWTLTDATFGRVTAAMSMLAQSDYVIIDLRDNPGGHGEIGDFMQSWFFPVDEPRAIFKGVHVDHSLDTTTGTYPFVPGKRLSDAKLYILVNAHTGSAAEGFAFGLQHIGRATIIGQTTAGAGIAGRVETLSPDLVMFLPDKLIVTMESGETWDGKGVAPDTVTAPGAELSTALDLIRKDFTEAGETGAPDLLPAPGDDADLPTPVAGRNLSACIDRTPGTGGLSLIYENRCDTPMTFQYLTDLKPNTVNEMTLTPHQRVRVRFSGAIQGDVWSIFAACPQGQHSDVPLTVDNRGRVEGDDYTCSTL